MRKSNSLLTAFLLFAESIKESFPGIPTIHRKYVPKKKVPKISYRREEPHLKPRVHMRKH